MLDMVIWSRWASGSALLLLAGLGWWRYAVPVGNVEVGPVTAQGGGKLPRGIRNNNPGNIEYNPANNWDGQTGSDGRYSTFENPFYGIRALARLIKNYGRFHGLRSVAGIISRWAPPTENNTQSYISAVADSVGVGPFEPVPDDKYPQLIAAIIHHENGMQPYSMALIKKAIKAAG